MGGKAKRIFFCRLFVAYLFFMTSALSAGKSKTQEKLQALENLLRTEVYFLHEKIESGATEREHIKQRMNETMEYIDDLGRNIAANMQVHRHNKQGNGVLETCPMKLEQVNVTIEHLQETVERISMGISEEKKVRKTDKDAVIFQLKKIEEQQNGIINDMFGFQTEIARLTAKIGLLDKTHIQQCSSLKNELERLSKELVPIRKFLSK